MRLPTLGAPDRIDEAAAAKLLRDAIEAGVNYIDTAWFYHSAVSMAAGESEPFVGRALSGEWRERINLATKLPQQLVKAREDMDDFLARQLERLQTEHIDFYLVHGLNGESWNRMRDLGVREFLDTARKRGLIRHAAFSFHGAKEDFPRIIDEYDGWAFGQIQYNYVDTEYQAGISGLRYASGKGLDVEKVIKATQIAHERAPELLLEGPLQYDAAVDIEVAHTKMPDSAVAGRATVFIFPDLNTGNNTYKAVQRSAQAVAIGPVLQGLNKPINDLSRGCTVPDIVNTVAITAIQAQAVKKG